MSGDRSEVSRDRSEVSAFDINFDEIENEYTPEEFHDQNQTWTSDRNVGQVFSGFDISIDEIENECIEKAEMNSLTQPGPSIDNIR